MEIAEAAKRVLDKLNAMSEEELILALEQCEETSVGRAIREGQEFIASMDYETLNKCGLVLKPSGFGISKLPQ